MVKHFNVMAVAAALAFSSTTAIAQDYPNGNIVFVVPYSPGGGTDLASRMLTERMAAENGWTFVVENRAGAGGNMGMSQLSRSPTDGLTLGMGQTANLAINPTLYEDIPYDSLTDFTPIAIVNSQPTVIAVPANSQFQTLGDLVEAAKADSSPLSMATPGAGTVAHLTLELFGTVAGIEFLHIPYPGASQAVTDTLGGHVDFVASSLPSALSQIRSGALRALAVTSEERNPAVPDVPTVMEQGYDNFIAGDWKAVVAPAGLPDDVVVKLNEAVNTALEDEALRAAFMADGSTVVGGSPDNLRDLIEAEHARWAEIIEQSGATVE